MFKFLAHLSPWIFLPQLLPVKLAAVSNALLDLFEIPRRGCNYVILASQGLSLMSGAHQAALAALWVNIHRLWVPTPRKFVLSVSKGSILMCQVHLHVQAVQRAHSPASKKQILQMCAAAALQAHTLLLQVPAAHLFVKYAVLVLTLIYLARLYAPVALQAHFLYSKVQIVQMHVVVAVQECTLLLMAPTTLQCVSSAVQVPLQVNQALLRAKIVPQARSLQFSVRTAQTYAAAALQVSTLLWRVPAAHLYVSIAKLVLTRMLRVHRHVLAVPQAHSLVSKVLTSRMPAAAALQVSMLLWRVPAARLYVPSVTLQLSRICRARLHALAVQQAHSLVSKAQTV